MSKRKKKSRKEEHVDESWLLPYADLLTLLLALFIVLFAMSEVDSQRFEAISQSFNNALTGGSGVMDNPSPLPDPKAVSSKEIDKEETTEELVEDPESEGINKKESKDSTAADQTELKEIQKKVNSYIKTNELSAKLETSLTDEGLLISIRESVLFSSGSAEVRSNDQKIAGEISELLELNPPRNIVISGHTDNIPIKTAKFDSNWELSVMRSINFMKLLLKNKDLDPSWFSAKGFGEFDPVADNNTAEGRSKNRRVEILILPRSN